MIRDGLRYNLPTKVRELMLCDYAPCGIEDVGGVNDGSHGGRFGYLVTFVDGELTVYTRTEANGVEIEWPEDCCMTDFGKFRAVTVYDQPMIGTPILEGTFIDFADDMPTPLRREYVLFQALYMQAEAN